MELLYPGYKSYFSRFRIKPFHTEYTTRYCNSEAPELYSQVPKYTWYEPRRPSVAARDEGTTKLTHLRPPFAARMTSYEPEVTYQVGKTACREATLSGRSGSFERRGRSPLKLPEVYPTPTERGLSKEGSMEDHELQMERIYVTKNTQGARTLDRCSEEVMLSNPPSNSGDEWMLGRVAPRPSSLLSKHPKDVRYVRDTCFFQPTQERKRHYYIVNPNWFSEQRVTVPRNNVFS